MGFLRFDELANIQVSDLEISLNHLILHIPCSKGDQLVIARTGTSTCPVAMLEAYMERGQIQLGSKEKLFRGIVNGKVSKLTETGGLS